MASAETLVRIYTRKYTLSELESAQSLLLEASLEDSDVIEQRLAQVGFTFRVRNEAERDRRITILEAAIERQSGAETPSGRGHSMDFRTRRIE